MTTNASKKILITGASGFIGGFLVDEALERGYEVWAGIRPKSDRSHLQDPRIRFIDLPYTDETKLANVIEEHVRKEGRWDYVIHNAGLTKTPDKRLFFEVNAENTRRFLEALSPESIRPDKFLLMSSLSSYGIGDELGFRPFSLDDQQRPNTAYGQSKLLAEQYVRRQEIFPYIILRPTGVYGPGERDYFVEIKAVNSGWDLKVGFTPQRLTFIYVKDLARATFLCLENEALRNREYFVADGDIHTDGSFARLIQELLGKKHVIHARLPLGLVHTACITCEMLGKLFHRAILFNTDKYLIFKQRNWICDVGPLQRDTGFRAEYDLRRGLTEAIAWYRQQGWLS